MSACGSDFRERALQNGTLIDVSGIAEAVGLPFSVAVSARIYNHPRVKNENRAAYLHEVLRYCLATPRFLSGDEVGDGNINMLFWNIDYFDGVYAHVVVERESVSGSVVATVYEQSENRALQGSSASLYEQ